MTTATDDRTSAETWRDHVETVPPTVLVLGGFLTAPPMYRRFVQRLHARGAAGVIVANVWTPDWLVAATRGLAAISLRGAAALRDAWLLAEDVSEGAPVLVVGHSAGGLVARLLTADEPFPGRRFHTAARIGAIVTLGTPHIVSSRHGIGRRISGLAAALADATVPGARFAPEIGYVAVASRAVTGDPGGSGQERISYELYRSLIGSAASPGTTGDGLVPVRSALLPGAQPVLLESSVHGPGAGAGWYGTDEAMDVWWPVAVEAWREALACRAAKGATDLDGRAIMDAREIAARARRAGADRGGR